MKKLVNVIVLLAIIYTNLISCNSSSNKDSKDFDLDHAKKVKISMEELNPPVASDLSHFFDDADNSYHNGLKSFEKMGYMDMLIKTIMFQYLHNTNMYRSSIMRIVQ